MQRHETASDEWIRCGRDRYDRIGHQRLIAQIHVDWWHRHDVEVIEVLAQAVDDAIAI